MAWEENPRICLHMQLIAILSRTGVIPIYIQRSIHSLVAITNPGSHRTVTDDDVAKGRAPYLLRSLIFEMLNVLHWCRKMSHIEKDLVLAAIELAKNRYEQERKSKNKQQ